MIRYDGWVEAQTIFVADEGTIVIQSYVDVMKEGSKNKLLNVPKEGGSICTLEFNISPED